MGTPEEKTINGSRLTRQQQREMDRRTEKAMQMFNSLCERFAKFIYETDGITDEMVAARRKELNAKWSLYVKDYRLNESSKTAFKDYCDKFYEAYKAELNGGEDAEVKAS